MPAVWNAWLQKNAREERERAASRTRTVKWICIIALVAASLFSASFFTITDSGYQTSMRFVISLGGLAVLMQSIRTRQYGFTVVFVGIMLLFNPLLPAFGFSGKWAILLAGIIPFAASLIWMKEYSQVPSTLLANGSARSISSYRDS
jgi:predicted membrane channel-forming protein YqfA (hemolysin III family)